MASSGSTTRCPQCGAANACEADQPNNNCWCNAVPLTAAQRSALASQFGNDSCLCKRCLMQLASNVKQST